MLPQLLSVPGRLSVASVLVLFLTQVAAANTSFSIKTAPPWVQNVAAAGPDSNQSSASSSTSFLDDVQIKVGHKTVERYYHFVNRVDNPSGLNDLSQLRFYFEPSYQKLTIHFVRIKRGNQDIDALRPSEIKMIQQEEELDQQLYNGTQAALIFVHDLRVGDIVDYAFTITGENPVLQGRFAESFYVGTSVPIKEWVLRLIVPTKRQLVIKNANTGLQPTTRVTGEDTEYLWYQKDVVPVSTEDSTPSWYSPFPRITVSEFQQWSDVVDWALPFYSIEPIKGAELRAKVEEWKNASPSQDERAIAALRFIQDEIRYLGIELGRYSHQPTPPHQVYARRFGDCKDKSLLLATVYNAMGIEAVPVLVNSYRRSAIDSWQASPFAFDHVIVKATINGKTYWFDPTIRFQRGGLNSYYPPPYERALVLKAGTKDLERMPVPTTRDGSIDVVEVYSRRASHLPIELNVTTTYRGSRADYMREDLSTSSPADLGKSYLNFYSESTPSIKADGLPSVEDDQKTNSIVIKERYVIDELWKENRHRFVAEKIWGELEKPDVSQRAMPLSVSYPLSIKETILIDLGPGYSLPLYADTFSDDAMRFEYRYSKNGNQLRVECSLQTFADSVPVEKVREHLAVIDNAQQFVGFELTKPSSGFASEGSEGGVAAVIGLVVGVAVLLVGGAAVLALVIWLVRSPLKSARSAQFAEQLKPRLGASPEMPLTVSSEEQLEAALKQYGCRCGHHPYNPSAPPSRDALSYDGKRLVAINLVCDICRYSNNLYFHIESRADREPLTTAGNELVNP